MASGSGSSEYDTGQLRRTPSRRMTRQQTMVEPPLEEAPDSELVPSSLASIVPILRVANEIEGQNPRVAYLCRFYAFEKAHNLDPTSSGRGVRQFKTYLLHKLQKDEEENERRLARNDLKEIQLFYQLYYDKYVKEGPERKPEEMAKHYQIASVLYDVLKTVAHGKVDDEIDRQAKEVERKKVHFGPYNILPLHVSGPAPAIMELAEIKAAINELRQVENLPRPSVRSTSNPHQRVDGSLMPEDGDISVNDLLDWLGLTFGFQKGNVENQREHLILLLANMDIRNRKHRQYSLLQNDTVSYLMHKVFKNYYSWCAYLHRGSNINFPNNAETQQLDLLYIGLYFLIWGEASNVRFMPECLCYIFHHMADELYGIIGNVHLASGGYFEPSHQGEKSFLQQVVTPIYQVMRKEVQRNKGGTASHSRWRNYDDLNEYFWSNDCFKLGWPMNFEADFFDHSVVMHPKTERRDLVVHGRRKPKTNFVEVRTFWHLFRSFDRMWIFFILAFQAMLIIAWSPSGSLTAFFDPDVFRSVLSIFITAALLNFLQAALDIILSWKAWGSMEYTQIIRYLLKFAVATAWIIILPIGYSSSVQNPTGLTKFFSNWIGNWRSQSLYSFAVVIYMIPNILAALLFMLPPLRRAMERSNMHIVILLMWWAQPKLYVGRGMHEDIFSLLKYTLFWILLLISKLAFSYYVEIYPLVEPTKTIMSLGVGNYEWHEFFPTLQHNIGVIITIWAPIVLVYFMDAQIWYAIFSTIFGGIHGAFSHLGEIRTLGMLRSRFQWVPSAFSKRLVPVSEGERKRNEEETEVTERRNIAKFSHVWNAFINSLRDEDLINNWERSLLLVPYSSDDISVVQWPPFLLASRIPIALDMAKDYKGKDDAELEKKLKSDPYMFSAVIECYETLRDILYGLLKDDEDKEVVRHICHSVDSSIDQREFSLKFRMSELPQLSNKLEKLLKLLTIAHDDADNIESYRTQIANVLQDIMEIITQDVMINGHGILRKSSAEIRANEGDKEKLRFSDLNLELVKNKSWKEKVDRLLLLLTVKESAINVPMNLDARRRITFFANSLFMIMPNAPKIRKMLSFSVLTPYYKEDVLYSEEELNKENEDGISILFYLRKIYPDEWKNFLERINYHPKEGDSLKEKMEHVRHWVSYRGQTLSRTVRGMMYYRRALELQCFLDMAEHEAIMDGTRTSTHSKNNDDPRLQATAQAFADIKFTYVVSCQVYGMQKKSTDTRDRSCYQNILNLMIAYPSLRVAYIDEREETVKGEPVKCYYSVLVKAVNKLDEEIYRIKLPGNPTEIGEGKPENQNHAIIFTRGEALQTIDMNQDNYLEEAFKMRNVLEELDIRHGQSRPTILGLREHIFTGSVSSLAWFMSNQETSFVTIGQRILANPLKVRFHYGHPDIFDRIFHLTRGGISKASKTINLSEDIFAGFNSTLRGGNVTHHEYMQVGKGRDVGMNQISQFEAKVANGNGEQTLSRDVYRLGRRFDFYRMLSFYFTTVGFYFSSMVTVLTVYVFLYGRLYLVMSGLERSILENPTVQNSKALESALAPQSVFQLGLLLVLPMVMEIGLEKGFRTAVGEFIIMQLQLASVFFTFQLGTKAHYYGRTLLHGGAKYRATGRGFVVFHAKFAENYRLYSRSHFVKGLELMILLVVYEVYGQAYRSSTLYLFITVSMWFLVASWLFAPFVFNPSGFEWQKTVDDWTDWKRWMGNRGGIGIPVDRSWESWWQSEQEHLKYTSIRGRVLEIILALRFLIYQYGIVYHLNIAHHSRSILVYGLSWFVMLTVLIVLKMVSVGRQRFATDFQLMFRILKGLLFLGFVSVMTVLFVVCGLTISDVFAGILGFVPTGWSLLLIAQASRLLVRRLGFWDSIQELGRAYEYTMGIVIFMPIVVLSWFPFVSEFQTRLLFNQAFSRGLQISRILAGRKENDTI
ncbi:callose synthase 7 [Elaeis guineensis]|uniref:1,3-beta-glucan synthase n=1 Tax=Elaeis guineensis var. tenera TaxID=51953 RepID=A0A6I9RBU3_ELAGV|nr:callose synthase 7 isoform X2 [Elaeis guineensis]